MRWLLTLLLLACEMVSACSVTRKVSKVGIREPASTQGETQEISTLRASFIAVKNITTKCTKTWILALQRASMEKIEVPHCPQAFEEAYPLTEQFLRIEERSLVEQVHDSRCSTILRSQLDVQLRSFLDTFESSGPIGRMEKAASEQNPDFVELRKLHASMEEMFRQNFPIERRIVNFGEYLISEQDLRVLNEIVVKRSCSLDDANLEEVYQTMGSLEELASLIKNESEKGDLQEVLQGLHKIVDNKITEYFSSK